MLKKFRNIFGHEVVINLSAIATAEECFPDETFDDDRDGIFIKIKFINGDIVEVVGTLDDLVV